MGRKHDALRILDALDERFEKINKKREGAFYQVAKEEFDEGDIDENLWAACQAHCNFNKRKAAGLYIRELAERYREEEQGDAFMQEQEERYSLEQEERCREEREDERFRQERKFTAWDFSEEKQRQKRNFNAMHYHHVDHQRKHDEEIKRQKNEEYKQLAGIDSEPFFGFTKFVYNFVRAPIGALFMFFFVGVPASTSIGPIPTTIFSIFVAAGGWVLFGSMRALLIPTFKKEKKYAERHNNPERFLIISASFSIIYIALILQISKLF